MNDKPLLIIKANCRQNTSCIFKGEDMFIDIVITNDSKTAIGFPLDFLRKTGPTIRLVDNKTKKETYLKTNPADWGLRTKMTNIQPSKSVEVEWVIFASEIKRFGEDNMDLTAEISFQTEVKVKSDVVPFLCSDKLHIVGSAKK